MSITNARASALLTVFILTAGLLLIASPSPPAVKVASAQDANATLPPKQTPPGNTNKKSHPPRQPSPTPTPRPTPRSTPVATPRRAPEIEIVPILGGTFMMGSAESYGNYQNEGPQHRVKVPSFYMGKYEVTQAQWRAVMGNNPSRFKGYNRPVDSVSWLDAMEFCRRLSQMAGQVYRLPTEAEWEYACRAGTQTHYAFGLSLSTEQANFDAVFGQDAYRRETTPVGTFPPNAFGLYDMHGNVSEWCADLWHESYNGAPADGAAWLTGGAKNLRVLRGGSWYNRHAAVRSASRAPGTPGAGDRYVGFRVAADTPK